MSDIVLTYTKINQTLEELTHLAFERHSFLCCLDSLTNNNQFLKSEDSIIPR